MQEKLLLSNFWENIHENLKQFESLGDTESIKISSELLMQFNRKLEYFGDFNTLLVGVANMMKNDEKIRGLFSYDEKELSTLLMFLESQFDKTIEMANGKLKDKVNKAMQLWLDKKQDDEIANQKALQKTLDAVGFNAKLDANTLSDFGEKIGGAKKDTYRKLEDITSTDIMSQPLSKSFPEPDYVKLVADGVITVEGSYIMKYLYSKIPTKPRNKYKLARWASTVQDAIDMFMNLISIDGSNLADKFVQKMPIWLKSEYNILRDTLSGLGFPNKNVTLGNFQIKIFENYFKFDENGDKVIQPTRYTIVSGSSIVKDFTSMDEAVEGLRIIFDGQSEKGKEKKSTKFFVWHDTIRDKFFIGKKTSTGVLRLVDDFEVSKDAHNFLKENQEKLQEIWNLKTKPIKERPEINKDRVGVDWRNNENITAEKLSTSFGFRGIEFGNYVNTKERQDHVNGAFDGLMDLATTIGIPTELLAFGGKLGLAFGARGSGNASAHYESEKVVINLTKKSGAGSLAHEYWHALDNFFGKKRNNSYAGRFMTEKPRVLMMRDGTKDMSVNHELVDAFKNIIDAINSTGIVKRSLILDGRRSKLYWSTEIELTARCFENYIIEKLGSTGTKNDYLANFSAMSEWVMEGDLDVNNSYPYPLADESDIINEAYEQFFVVLKKVGLE